MDDVLQSLASSCAELQAHLNATLRSARDAAMTCSQLSSPALYAVRTLFDRHDDPVIRLRGNSHGVALVEPAMDALQKGTQLLMSACESVTRDASAQSPYEAYPIAIAALSFDGIGDGWPRSPEEPFVVGAVLAPYGLGKHLERVMARRAATLNIGAGPSLVRQTNVVMTEASDVNIGIIVDFVLTFRRSVTFLSRRPELSAVHTIYAASWVAGH